tara:strand:- start:140 stop:307 length:168 start_codon:yes stop_codon:yes gene_type:complete
MFIKKKITIILLLLFLQNCSTVVNVVDKTASGVVDVIGATLHYTTCPVTKKKCFD